MRALEVESPASGGRPGFQDSKQTSDGAIVALPDEERKGAEDRAARAALAGIQAYKLANGGWLVARWNLCRELADDGAFDSWLGQVTGAR